MLEQVLAEDEGLNTGYQLLQRFRKLIAERDVPALVAWLVDAEASDLPSFVTWPMAFAPTMPLSGRP